MNYKALAYLILIIILVILSLFFFYNAFGKDRKNKFISGKWSLLIGVVLLAISMFVGIDFVHRVYEKMKSTIVSLQNFPQTVDTESSDTTDYVRALKKYEPEKFKGKIPEDYYSYYGSRNYWRFPLVFPYAVSCIDVLEKAGIENDSGVTDYEKVRNSIKDVPIFDRFTFDKKYLAAKIITDEQYFVFSFETGKIEIFKSNETLQKYLDEIKFQSDRKFITIRQYSERF